MVAIVAVVVLLGAFSQCSHKGVGGDDTLRARYNANRFDFEALWKKKDQQGRESDGGNMKYGGFCKIQRERERERERLKIGGKK